MLLRSLSMLATLAAMSAAFAAPIPPVQGHPEPAHRVRSLISPDQSVPKPPHPAAWKAAKPAAKKALKKPSPKPIPHPLWGAKGYKPAKSAKPAKPGAHKPGFAKPLAAKPLPKKPFSAKSLAAKSLAAKLGHGKPLAKKLLLGKPKAVKLQVKVGPPAFERKTIQAKYDAMSLLVMRRDANRLATLLMGMTTKDFVYRDKKGRPQNRAKLVGDLKRQLKAVRSFKRSGNRVAGFAMKGPVGTAHVVSDFAMVFPNGPKSVTVAGQSLTQDTWIKTAAGWKLRSIRTLKESVKYNGRAM